MHVLTDGRDVEDGTSVQFITQLVEDLQELEKEHGCDAKVASGGGRMKVTMDRYEVGAIRVMCILEGGLFDCRRGLKRVIFPWCLSGLNYLMRIVTRTSTYSHGLALILHHLVRSQSDWDIVKRGWQAHVLGKAPNKFRDPVEAINTLRVSAEPVAFRADQQQLLQCARMGVVSKQALPCQLQYSLTAQQERAGLRWCMKWSWRTGQGSPARAVLS